MLIIRLPLATHATSIVNLHLFIFATAKQRTDSVTNRERFKTAQGSSENSSLDMSGSNTAINILSSRKFQQRNCHLLAQSPTEKLIGLLKEHAGLKECSEETANHINSVCLHYIYFIYGF